MITGSENPGRMPATLRRNLSLILVVISLGWLCLDAPGPFLREAYFVLLMLALTVVTRSVSWRLAVLAVSTGIGVAAPLMVAIGWLLARAGFDVSESELGSWGVVPFLEELVKLAPVAFIAWMYRRKTKLTLNPSDWLVVGCAAGAGFAMVENAQLVGSDPGVLRDMAEQYGPTWLVPGAWGAAGFVGHAAATGFAAAGVGLSRALGREAAARGASRVPGRVALAAPFAWVTLEHVLANLRVSTGSTAALLLGNGRLTPWLFVVVVALIVYRDYDLARRALAHSKILRVRRALAREALLGTRLPTRRTPWQRALVAAGELRLVNAAAWCTLERLVTGGTAK